MSADYRITQIKPVIGDWFCISEIDHKKWFIERVIALGLVQSENDFDHVVPILPNGCAPAPEDRTFYLFPSHEIGFLGLSWGEVYQQANAELVISRDITELVQKHRSTL